MLGRQMRTAALGWVVTFLLLIGLSPAGIGAGPNTQAADTPAASGPTVMKGSEVPVSGGYSRADQPGAHIESRILSVPAGQANVVYLSAPVEAPFGFSDVAPHWDTPPPRQGETPDDNSIRVELRTGPDGATWTDWQQTNLEGIQDPRDPLTRTYGSLVGVPQDVRTHRYAQARITLSSLPGVTPPTISNLTFSFIDSGVTAQVPVATLQGGPPPVKPAIISRAQWGSPDGNASPNWPPEYKQATHVIIHHTETSNADGDYAARVRSIWYFHAITRGWGDIGYNYLIDPHGNVYEGRYGGDDVAAGHAYPFNYGSIGISLIGNYDQTAPSSAMRDSLIKLLAWATDRRGINPQGIGAFTGALNCGGSVTLVRPNIAGHRDFRGQGCGQEFNDKTCPGAYAYAMLPQIRAALGTGLPEYRAIFSPAAPLPQLTPGSTTQATITVRNGGGLTWPSGGPSPVKLGFRWYTSSGTRVYSGFTDIRTALPRDVPYGATVVLQASLSVPSTPGAYDLHWDMVEVNQTWFEDAGSNPLTVRVLVAASDTTSPTARVSALPPYQGSAQFPVSWSGADNPGGSGLASYDIQVRAGANATWTDWQTATTATTAVFQGTNGVTYYFRARARDKAGNVGAYPEAPDTSTTVVTGPPALVITSPHDGDRVAVGSLLVSGHTDPGATVTVNGSDALVDADGSFHSTVVALGADFPITVQAQGVTGRVSRSSIVVHVGPTFSDVPPGSFAYKAVGFLSGLGLVSGYSDGTFRPNGAITRADFMKMLATALNYPQQPPAKPSFKDVPPNYPASGAIAAGIARGLVGGYSDGTFRPDGPVTRIEVVKVLTLAANWQLQQGAQSPFSDVPLTYWAYPYVETAYRHGIIQDSPAGRLRPDAQATRAEATVFLYYTLGDLAASGKWP
ncbi:MAG: S-layer homology domain-containing protein [Chloroflexia bacterium]